MQLLVNHLTALPIHIVAVLSLLLLIGSPGGRVDELRRVDLGEQLGVGLIKAFVFNRGTSLNGALLRVELELYVAPPLGVHLVPGVLVGDRVHVGTVAATVVGDAAWVSWVVRLVHHAKLQHLRTCFELVLAESQGLSGQATVVVV